MASVTLNAYEVIVRKKRSDDFQVLSDYNNGQDLLLIINNILDSWSYQETEESVRIVEDINTSKRLRIKKDSISVVGRTIGGIIETGEYGYESDVVNSEGNHTKTISRDESPMLPFYFIGFFPKDKTTGIFIFQKFKNLGAYGVFKKNVEKAFRKISEGYKIEMNPLFSKKLVEEFINNGAIRQISFKNTLHNNTIAAPSDRTTPLDKDDYYTEYNIVAKRNKKLGLIKRIQAHINGNDNLDDLVSLQGFAYNDIMVTLELENHKRTLSLSGLDKLGSFFDITDNVNLDFTTGLPNQEEIKKESRKVLDDIINIAKLTE